jgi:hypothetical protein
MAPLCLDQSQMVYECLKVYRMHSKLMDVMDIPGGPLVRFKFRTCIPSRKDVLAHHETRETNLAASSLISSPW